MDLSGRWAWLGFNEKSILPLRDEVGLPEPPSHNQSLATGAVPYEDPHAHRKRLRDYRQVIEKRAAARLVGDPFSVVMPIPRRPAGAPKPTPHALLRKRRDEDRLFLPRFQSARPQDGKPPDSAPGGTLSTDSSCSSMTKGFSSTESLRPNTHSGASLTRINEPVSKVSLPPLGPPTACADRAQRANRRKPGRRPAPKQPDQDASDEQSDGPFNRAEIDWAVRAWSSAARAHFGAGSSTELADGGELATACADLADDGELATACAEWLAQCIGAQHGNLHFLAELDAACLGLGIGETESTAVAARLWAGFSISGSLPVASLLRALEEPGKVAQVPLPSTQKRGGGKGKRPAPQTTHSHTTIPQRVPAAEDTANVVDTLFIDERTEPEEDETEAVARLQMEIGLGVRVCILGSVELHGTEELVQRLAREVSIAGGTEVVFLTGGMTGAQKLFAENCCDGSRICNILPLGQASGYRVGQDFQGGVDLEQRRKILARLADVCISVEGGPGTAEELQAAFTQGACVLPLMCSGGASAGMFDLPRKVLERPRYATEEQWEMLHRKDVEVGVPVAAAAAIFSRYLEVHRRRSSQGASRLSLPTVHEAATEAYVETPRPSVPAATTDWETKSPAKSSTPIVAAGVVAAAVYATMVISSNAIRNALTRQTCRCYVWKLLRRGVAKSKVVTSAVTLSDSTSATLPVELHVKQSAPLVQAPVPNPPVKAAETFIAEEASQPEVSSRIPPVKDVAPLPLDARAAPPALIDAAFASTAQLAADDVELVEAPDTFNMPSPSPGFLVESIAGSVESPCARAESVISRESEAEATPESPAVREVPSEKSPAATAQPTEKPPAVAAQATEQSAPPTANTSAEASALAITVASEVSATEKATPVAPAEKATPAVLSSPTADAQAEIAPPISAQEVQESVETPAAASRGIDEEPNPHLESGGRVANEVDSDALSKQHIPKLESAESVLTAPATEAAEPLAAPSEALSGDVTLPMHVAEITESNIVATSNVDNVEAPGANTVATSNVDKTKAQPSVSATEQEGKQILIVDAQPKPAPVVAFPSNGEPRPDEAKSAETLAASSVEAAQGVARPNSAKLMGKAENSGDGAALMADVLQLAAKPSSPPAAASEATKKESDGSALSAALRAAATSSSQAPLPVAARCKFDHVLERIAATNDGWACDGRLHSWGCKHGITDYFQTNGLDRYECRQCDFDLCTKCHDFVLSEGPDFWKTQAEPAVREAVLGTTTNEKLHARKSDETGGKKFGVAALAVHNIGQKLFRRG